ncbi:MAG: hypothetical protein J07HX64_01211 [halophilic archaeon J07HX64]|jgi:hypothetical protein|nr:MAG: hypothetical protein J07HX64_01211 [halophilic archaeon J07HX64]
MSTDDMTNDNPAHPDKKTDSLCPMGERRTEVHEKPAETDYDADLGVQTTRDARRPATGEITKKDFCTAYYGKGESA